MKIFLSYGHDSNAPLIEKIRDYLSTDTEENLKHEVWIDTSEIKAGMNWREKIVKGLLESDIVLAGLSEHSTKEPGVCRDEISISIGVKGGNIKTILLEPSNKVAPPAMISHIQWLDMSDWRKYETEGFDSDYFKEKFRQIADMIETPENERFNGEITQLKEALEPISAISRIKSLTEKEMYGRKWLYEKIEEWDKSSSQRLFWIVAGPGFGKSMFAANLQEQYNARIPAIQFVEWGKPDHSNPCRILKNLAFQLAVRYPEYRTFVLQQPDVINKKLNEKNEDELFDLLFCESTWMKIDGGQENVWVLIDALDEANDKFDNKIAQTLARHMDRMPQWIRFILTSRDDSKVRLPLQKYQPQIFDFEEYVKEKNSEDLLLYVREELSNLHPSEEQVRQIVDKSQGVFLYLSLCVEGIHNGDYSLEYLDKLPDGLNGYYFQNFNRLYNNRLDHYKNAVLPILEVVVGSKEEVSISFAQYCSGLEDEYSFFEALREIEPLCKSGTIEKHTKQTISFFHSSLKDWLTDYNSSGQYYVSPNKAEERILRYLGRWLKSDELIDDSFWSENGFGFQHLNNEAFANIERINKRKLFIILDSIYVNSTFGDMLSTRNDNVNTIIAYIDNLILSRGNITSAVDFINVLSEAIKDKYIESGFVSKETRSFSDDYDAMEKIAPTNVWSAVKSGAVIGIIGHYISGNKKKYPKAFRKVLKDKMQLFAYYDYRIGDIFLSVRASLSDLGDFASREMNTIIEKL